jgi:hypothetical protein
MNNILEFVREHVQDLGQTDAVSFIELIDAA